jgi:CheY-like chemotaxis protein
MVDLRELLEEAVQLTVPKWRTQAQARGIFIDVAKELAEVPLIPASAPELREVMMNLIFNAVDAMPRGGRIAVRTGMEGELAFFEIEDTGEGMSEEARRHCMEPFYTTKGTGGTGLGLATAHGIVRRHRGYIGIDSDIGQGTRFTVLLPVKAVEKKTEEQEYIARPETSAIPAPLPRRVEEMKTWARPALEPETRPERVPPHALRVLVVDDQPDVCRVLRHYLECDSHKVETAANGCEALEKFRDHDFDVVITDRAMPKMNGVQLASAIKGMHPGEPVILLTAFAGKPEKMSPDVDVQLDKPASLHKIRQAIRRVMAA